MCLMAWDTLPCLCALIEQNGWCRLLFPLFLFNWNFPPYKFLMKNLILMSSWLFRKNLSTVIIPWTFGMQCSYMTRWGIFLLFSYWSREQCNLLISVMCSLRAVVGSLTMFGWSCEEYFNFWSWNWKGVFGSDKEKDLILSRSLP